MGARLATFEPDASADAVTAALDAAGHAIIHGLLPEAARAALKVELAPWIARAGGSSEAFMGDKTKRFGALIARCPTSRAMATHPLILAVADKVLGPYCVRYQINYTGVMHLDPGEKTQPLHRDSSLYPFMNPAPPLILATMWAISDFTAENGATLLVPGSHRWDDKRAPTPEEVVPAAMPAGSALLYVGSLFHGAGANRANAARTGVALHYSLGWLRQEENQYMAMPMEEARRLPRRLQELMGYALASVNLGFVDHKDPNEVLNGTAGDGQGRLGDDLYAADSRVLRLKVSEAALTPRPRHQVEPASRETP
jgi:ectoine hydroxylase-related dioxygenase (phytanoyl-CoA dioxygenase family)